MRSLWKKGAALCAAVMCMCGLAACGPGEEHTEKITITVLVDDSASNMDLYRTKLAAKFPDIKFQFTFQNNLMPELELARRVAHRDVADLVFSSQLDVSIEGLSDCFMDLSGKSYTSRYQTSYLNSLDVDGHIYYLPADMAVEGMVYYRALFEEHNLEVPSNYEEFAALCVRLEEMGLRPGMLLTGRNAPAELFSRFYALDKKNSLSSWQWAEEFNQGNASAMEGGLESTLDIMSAYVGLGLISPQDFTISRSFLVDKPVALLFGDRALPYNMINRDSTDKFRLMPFFSPVDGRGYFFVVPLMSLAVGRQVEDDPQKEEAIDRVLEYITSDEGQQDLMSFDYGIVSPVSGLASLEDDFYYVVKDRLTDNTMLQLARFPACTYALNSYLGAYLGGEMSREELIALLDAANRGEGDKKQTLAYAASDFTLAETNDLALEAMRQALGTDAALLRQSNQQRLVSNFTICGKLYQGPVTTDDLWCVSPIQQGNPEEVSMLRVEMSGARLLELIGTDATYYYDGVTVYYEWDREMNCYRAAALRDAEGDTIDPESTVTVAMMAYFEKHPELSPGEVNSALYEER